MLKSLLILGYLFSTSNSFAQSILTQIPLDIHLGVTKYNEMEIKGFAGAGKPIPESSKSKSIRYGLDSNRFYAHIDFDNTINRISFHAVAHHQLPESWKKLGIRLASNYRYIKYKPEKNTLKKKSAPENGNSIDEFISIISSQKVNNIKRSISYKSDYQIEESVSFEIDQYMFVAAFMKWVKPEWCNDCTTYTEYDNGLISIEISRKI